MDKTAIKQVQRPFRHSVRVQMRFNDIDMLGHLNNSMYFSYFDIGKAEYFNAVRGGGDHWANIDVVVANVNCDFLAPVLFTEPIMVLTQVEALHDRSFTVAQQMTNEATGEVKAVCRSVMVSFDRATGRSAPLAPHWRQAITQYERFVEPQ